MSLYTFIKALKSKCSTDSLHLYIISQCYKAIFHPVSVHGNNNRLHESVQEETLVG